jgi:hypothetical protein
MPLKPTSTIQMMVGVLHPAQGIEALTVPPALHRMVLLNLLITGDDDLISEIPSQRLIFLTKHLLSISSFDEAPSGLQSELLSTLASILPPIKDLYGDFWHDAVTILMQYLGSIRDASEILPLHAALRLHACLFSLISEESNEDLEEELSKVKPSFEASLLDILTHFDGKCGFSRIETELKYNRNSRWCQPASGNHYCSARASGAESTVGQARKHHRALPSLII